MLENRWFGGLAGALTALTPALAVQATVKPTDWTTVLLALIAAIGTGFGVWITNQNRAIHASVNSAASKQVEENARQAALILKLTGLLAASEGDTALGGLAETESHVVPPKEPTAKED